MLRFLLALRTAKLDIRAYNRTGIRFLVIIDNIRRKKIHSVFVATELGILCLQFLVSPFFALTKEEYFFCVWIW